MIYTELTKKAMNIAYEAHHKQEDKGGFPYIHHSLHVAEQMDDEYSTCVALLHDVVEDSNISINELSKCFPFEIVNAVELLTHKKNMFYKDYIKLIKTNQLAKKVKLADLKHNLDETRLLTDNLKKGPNLEKYLMAYTFLKEK